MPYVELNAQKDTNLKIMIFTEGTVIKHTSLTRLYDYASYKPIGSCVDLISSWAKQGAEIIYCTSRKEKQVEIIRGLLIKYGFVGTRLYYREKGQTYGDIVEEVKPDILIEDDCRSIGGKSQMCIAKVSAETRKNIHSIPVAEFKGIDHLPEKLCDLIKA